MLFWDVSFQSDKSTVNLMNLWAKIRSTVFVMEKGIPNQPISENKVSFNCLSWAVPNANRWKKIYRSPAVPPLSPLLRYVLRSLLEDYRVYILDLRLRGGLLSFHNQQIQTHLQIQICIGSLPIQEVDCQISSL